MAKGSKFFNMGAQTRIITCKCGWHTQKAPRAADMLFRLHSKTCDIAKKHVNESIPFDGSLAVENGLRMVQSGLSANQLIGHVISSDGEHTVRPHNVRPHNVRPHNG
jgi:hypothetical protein